ncbi:hypothetical protein PF003_g9872 [Phytophthora fragariae]|nr:hypothetical protein PF003_g9872 [Phytophthora fragariae]
MGPPREGERTTGAVSGKLRTQKPMPAAHQRARKKCRAAARAVEGEEIQEAARPGCKRLRGPGCKRLRGPGC